MGTQPNQSPLSHHAVAVDPGTSWVKDAKKAIDAPPDGENAPAPEAQWPSIAPRTGVCGAVTPNVVPLADGGYRMYYTQILPRPGFPAGADDYDNSTTRILSATSQDASTWIPEAGVRLGPREGGAGAFRVVSPEVVPLADGSGRMRMYYECSPGPQSRDSTLRSAVSADAGLTWTVEPGVRFGEPDQSFNAPRLVFLEDGRCRLYCSLREAGIVSALSEDGGLNFVREPGLRIARGGAYDTLTAFAPEVLRIEGAGYRMYYAGWVAAPEVPAGSKYHGRIFSASSQDGLEWTKEQGICIDNGGRWDAAKASEPCVIDLPDGRFRMFYEACDMEGRWRIASATAVPST